MHASQPLLRCARSLWLGAAVLACLVVFSLGHATPAHAGVYTVSSCDASWRTDGWWPLATPVYATVYTDHCPTGNGMVARSVVKAGDSLAPYQTEAMWAFFTTPGTRIVEFAGQFRTRAKFPWTAGFKNVDTNVPQGCFPCLDHPHWTPFDLKGLSQHGIALDAKCWLSPGCRRDGNNRGEAYLRYATLYIADDTLPTVGITGGSLVRGGWRRGSQAISYSARDNTGIRTTRLLVDGKAIGRYDWPCDGHSPIPCPNRSGSLPIDTAAAIRTDGRHVITVAVTDGGYNTSSTSRTVYVDNTPPGQPTNLVVDEAGRWQATNVFHAHWTAAPVHAAPVAATQYELCPVGGSARACVRGHRRGSASAIGNLAVPADGAWQLRLWQQDAAGNQDRNRSAVAEPLLLDRVPPTVALRPPDPSDPDRLHLAAADSTSGMAKVSVEVRRRGTDAWVPVPVTGSAAAASAVIDDESLRRGTYDIRVTGIDRAGNERTTTTYADGRSAAIKLPARVVTTLKGGQRVRHRHHTHLARAAHARIGHRIRLYGRLLTPGRNPLPNATVDVFQRVDLPGTRWRRIGAVLTSRHGRFHYRMPAGPNRIVRFHYAGTATLRGSTRYVHIGVPAATTIKPTPRSTVNGGFVRFHGRLRGHWRPRGGKLVELQVYTRRRWRTFAQPRANARTGRWHYDYRFETIVGRVTFRFRARIRREAAYPFETGRSKVVRVKVRGL